MARRFDETTIGDTTYRTEIDFIRDAICVTAFTRIPGFDKRLANSVTIPGCEIEDEMQELGLDCHSEQQRMHTAFTMGVQRLKPQIDYHRAQALGEDQMAHIFDPSDPNMDPSLADALVHGMPAWVEEERRREKQLLEKALEARRREEEAREEAARIERERQQREREEMETCELWGAF